MSVTVHKDIGEYTEKVVGKMSGDLSAVRKEHVKSFDFCEYGSSDAAFSAT